MKHFVKFLAIIFSLLTIFTVLPVSPAFAANVLAAYETKAAAMNSADSEALLNLPDGYRQTNISFSDENGVIYYYIEGEASEYGWIDGYWITADGTRVDNIDTPMTEHVDLVRGDEADLPAAYDARDYGLITPVEDQIGGTCWAHAAIAVMESNAIKKGFATADSVNLSEYQLVWHAFNGYYPGITEGNNDGYIDTDAASFLDHGGNYIYVGYAVNNFSGPASENNYAFTSSYVSTLAKEMGEKFTFADKSDYDYAVTSIKTITNDRESIKNAVLTYGACQISYLSVSKFYTAYWYAGRNNKISAFYNPDGKSTNHAVTIVGWDDDFSVDNFTVEGAKPENNGAWLIKNSWGPEFGNDGYFWISYEEPTLSTPVVYEVSSLDEFQNAYLYDGVGYYTYMSCKAAANIFTANGDELLTKVSRGSALSETDKYSFKIYLQDNDYYDPAQGVLLYEQSGNGKGAKFIELNEPVALSKGDRFAVVFDNISSIPVENNQSSTTKGVNSNPGESFYQVGGIWYDACVEGKNNVCIRAITINQQSTYKVTYTDKAAYRITVNAIDGVAPLPNEVEDYTWVLEKDGEAFTGQNVSSNITVTGHLYPTDGSGNECYTEYKCVYCGKEMKDGESHHAPVDIPEVEPTCTSYGYKNGVECSVCGMQLITPARVAMLAHSWDEGAITKEPTCTQKGTKVATCTVCGKMDTTSVATIPHEYTTVRTEASATTIGFDTNTCVNCGYVKRNNFDYDSFRNYSSYSYYLPIEDENYVYIIKTKGTNCVMYKPGTYTGFTWSEDYKSYAENSKAFYLVEGTTALGAGCFVGTPNIKDIYLPATLKTIPAHAFAGLDSLETIHVDESNEYFRCVDGVIYSKDMTTLVYYPPAKDDLEFTVPASVTSIVPYAFEGCKSLKFLDMSKCDISTLGENSLVSISSVEYVNLPNVLTEINRNAISSPDSKLLSLYIPATVNIISENFFENYSDSTSIFTNSTSAVVAELNGYNVTVLANHTHAFSELVYDLSASGCNAPGLSVCTCECGQFDAIEHIIPHTKNSLFETLAPTCGEEGCSIYSCSICGENYKDDYIAATGNHSFDWIIDVEAACNSTGIRHEECTVCGATRNENSVIEATGKHSYEIVIDTPATCGAAGVQHDECAYCGTKANENTPIPATGIHIWNWETVTPAGCNSTGVQQQRCSVCSAIQSKNTVIPATGIHEFEWVVDVEPNCGQTGVKHEECKYCENVQSENTEIPTKGEHKWAWIIDTESNCGAMGSKHRECSICGVQREQNVPYPATGKHSFTLAAAKAEAMKTAPTCTSAGIYYYSCVVCGTVEGNDSHTFSANTSDHSFTAQIIKDEALKAVASCTSAAEYYYSCEYCGTVESNDSHVFTSGDAIDHIWEWITDNAATCGETGTKHEECTACDAKRNENTVIDATSKHNFEWKTDKAATCGEAGTKHEECTVCHAKQNENTVIDATGKHAFDGGTVTQTATCTAGGKAVFKCKNCGYSTVKDTAKDANNHVDYATELRNVKAATCSAQGYTGDKVCIGCGKTLESGNKTDKLTHTPKYIPAVDPTCTATGKTESVVCSVCNTVIQKADTIPAFGHKDSNSDNKCDICGAAVGSSQPSGNVCKYCGQVHSGFWGKIVGFFHNILALFGLHK